MPLLALLAPAIAAPPAPLLIECRAPAIAYSLRETDTLLRVTHEVSERSESWWLWYAGQTWHLTVDDGLVASHATVGLGARGGGVADDGGCPSADTTIDRPALTLLAARTAALPAGHVLATCRTRGPDQTDVVVRVEPTLQPRLAVVSADGLAFRMTASGWSGPDTLVGIGAAFDAESGPFPFAHLELRGADGRSERTLYTGVALVDDPLADCAYDAEGIRALKRMIGGS